jgi:hypothetical protein
MERSRQPATGVGTTRPRAPGLRQTATLPVRVAVVGAAVALSTGAGLVAYFVSGLALPLGIALALLVTGTVAVLGWRRLDADRRAVVRRRVRAGFLAGILATVAYDLTRFVVVTVFHLHVRPYAALPLFGQLLTGELPTTTTAWVVGIVYHGTNGICFAIAYAMLAAPRGVLTGIGFALVLEGFMLSFYPGWLHVQAIQEFFSMTILGHVAYGATLGVMARRLARTSTR